MSTKELCNTNFTVLFLNQKQVNEISYHTSCFLLHKAPLDLKFTPAAVLESAAFVRGLAKDLFKALKEGAVQFSKVLKHRGRSMGFDFLSMQMPSSL